MKTHTLIHKTMSQFFVCTAVIFVLMTPLFYLLTTHLYAEDLIEVIQSVKNGQGIPQLDLERDIMAGIMLEFILTFLILSAGMFITVRYITRRLWQPFDDTLRKAEQFSLEQNTVPDFADTDIAEFRRLNDSLGQLMRKNKETYRIQKEFTENASHELQTPLAVTRTKLDLLMQENLSEEQLSIVSELYQLNTRMGHLNRNLLLLAKIENSQYNTLEEISTTDFINSLLPSYNLLKGNCRVTIIHDNKNHWKALANAILLECLFNNLVINALRHTDAGKITIDMSHPGIITVTNPASQGPLDSDILFKRFRTGGYGAGRNGLGLAIVKAICDFHGWTVTYIYGRNRHNFIVNM